MKYRYYITDLHSGSIAGCDEREDAESLRHSEDHFVVDAQTGKWLTPNGDVDVKGIGEKENPVK